MMTRDLWRRTALAIQFFMVIGVSVSAQQGRTAAVSTLRITADVTCIVAIDGRPLGLVGTTPTVIRIPRGIHVFSASLGDQYYWERTIDVTAGAGALHVEFTPLIREQMAQELAIAEAGKRVRALEAITSAENGAAESLKREAAAITAKAAGAQRLLLERVQRVIAQIRELDRKFKAYSETAEKQAQDNAALRAEAERQNNGTAVGAIAGLLGNIAAVSGDGEARRNRLRAAAALRQMDRLTAALSIASDRGFDHLEDAITNASSFPMSRNNRSGDFSITAGKVEYRETGTSSGDFVFTATCADLRAVKASRRSITLSTRATKIELMPKKNQPEELLGEILLSCPERDF